MLFEAGMHIYGEGEGVCVLVKNSRFLAWSQKQYCLLLLKEEYYYV